MVTDSNIFDYPIIKFFFFLTKVCPSSINSRFSFNFYCFFSSNNVNFWKTRTKIYFSFASVDPKFVTAALTALEKAYSLSPLDPKIAYNLAVLHGRLGENDKAIEILKQTVALKPNYRDAYYALDVFYTELKQPELAKAILQEYLKKVDPSDKDFQDKLQALDQGKE